MKVTLSLVLLIGLLVAIYLGESPLINTDEHLDLTSTEYYPIVADFPRSAGLPLSIAARLLNLPIIGTVIGNIQLNANKFHYVRLLAGSLPFDYPPRFEPFHFISDDRMKWHEERRAEPGSHLDFVNKDPVNNIPTFRLSALDLMKLYREKKLTPTQVVKRVLNNIDHSQRLSKQPLNAFSQSIKEVALKLAEESTRRYQTGENIRPFEGVPFGVKEGYLSGFGYNATIGTAFIHILYPVPEGTPPSQFVERLLEAGGVIVGANNMIELGVSTIGYNHHWGIPRNPYNPSHYTGGSSSGSASAVSAGLVPFSIGGDGGGSIRIPSTICGVAGLKVTHGRISIRTALDTTLETPGPIGATVRDVALGYLLMSEKNLANSFVHSSEKRPRIPPAHVHQLEDIQTLKGLKIAFLTNYTKEATKEVQEGVENAIKILEKLGATVVRDKPNIPYLFHLSRAHAITILTEMATGIDKTWKSYKNVYGPEVSLNFGLARLIKATDYIAAQRLRFWATNYIKDNIFNEYDAIITPGTAQAAPLILDDALSHGEVNMQLVLNLMKYAFMANHLGFPAGVVPVSYTKAGGESGTPNLPIGVQFMADHWNEHIILRLMRAIEANVEVKKPQVYYDLVATS